MPDKKTSEAEVQWNNLSGGRLGVASADLNKQPNQICKVLLALKENNKIKRIKKKMLRILNNDLLICCLYSSDFVLVFFFFLLAIRLLFSSKNLFDTSTNSKKKKKRPHYLNFWLNLATIACPKFCRTTKIVFYGHTKLIYLYMFV